MLIITCILREYTILYIDEKLNQRTAHVYFAGDDDVDDVTGPLSHPATNRNVYFTRRKLAPRACAKGDVASALRCAHFPSAFGALFLHPLRSRAPVFFPAAG